jgi:hypothetical protein
MENTDPRIKLILLAVKIVTAVVIVMIVGWYLNYLGINIPHPFKARPIVIDKTANVIENIRRLAELTTATYYEDNVTVKEKTEEYSLLGVNMDRTNELVLITKGKVRAGFDLSALQKQDIFVDSVSITLKLPQPQLLDIITNPSDFETFEEDGKWSHEDVTSYKNEARAIIEKNALESGILKRAEKSGREKLTAFLQALGFKEVNILLRD